MIKKLKLDPQPIAVDARTAAAMFGVSESTWRRWQEWGYVPRPRSFGPTNNMPRWGVEELQLWWQKECPGQSRIPEN